MNEQTLGQVRALLSALAGVLIAFGLKDGHQWQPAIGVAVLGISFTWGLYNKTGMAALWSTLRKLLNTGITAAATYGFLSTDRAEALIALIGPVVIMVMSWKANK